MIISHARCGSTFLDMYVKRANEKFYGLNVLGPSTEFFNVRWNAFYTQYEPSYHLHHLPILNSVSEKSTFLENERTFGREYSVKVLAYQVKNYREWFDEFYKDWDKIILLRKDRWRAYLSYEIQSYLKWNVRTTHNRQDEMVSNLKPFLVNVNRVKWWFEEYTLSETHKGSKIYLEDVSHDSLCDMFNIYCDPHYKEYTIDYEPYILNLDIIKSEFHKQENNFYPR
mgnify:FL=1|jgi:hypothetical protein